MFKQYLRYANGQPFGVVVLDGTNFGWSLCNPVDRFDKKKALLAAEGRAKTGKNWITILSYKEVKLKHVKKNEIEIRRGEKSIVCESRVSAVLDKMCYLRDKLLK